MSIHLHSFARAERAARLYRRLLRAYPLQFRRRYGDVLVEAARDMRGAPRYRARFLGEARFWFDVLRDLGVAVIRLRTLPLVTSPVPSAAFAHGAAPPAGGLAMLPSDAVPVTANERFKNRFREHFWGSLIFATAVHFAILAFFPAFTAPAWGMPVDAAPELVPVPDYELPEPPTEIRRPAAPVIVAGDEIPPDLPYDPMGFKEYVAPPPPPPTTVAETSRGRAFTPFTVAPGLRNPEEVQQALKRHYPSLLRDAGIGGTVVVEFHIDVDGSILDRRIAGSSGHAALDNAALDVADVMRFSPALNRDQHVRVWVRMPITFRVQRSE